MSEKTKRKGTPRRFSLGIISAVVGIVIVSMVMAFAFNTLQQPAPEEIIYGVSDGDHIESVYIMDIHQPENARKIDTIRPNSIIGMFEDNLLLKRFTGAVVSLDMHSPDGTITEVEFCPPTYTCYLVEWLPIKNNWLPYTTRLADTGETFVQDLYVYHLATGERMFIGQMSATPYDYVWFRVSGFWLEDGHKLGFPQFATDDMATFAVYDFETDTIETDFLIVNPHDRVIPSTDGTHYVVVSYTSDGYFNSRQIVNRLTGDSLYPEGIYIEDDWIVSNVPAVDWHPTEALVVMAEEAGYAPDDSTWGVASRTYLNLYHAETGEKTNLLTLPESYIYLVQFNPDGTKILVSSTVYQTYEIVHYVIDVQTGESTILPIAGVSPQWVE